MSALSNAIEADERMRADKAEIEHLRDRLRSLHHFLTWPGKSWPKEIAELERELIEAEPWWKQEQETSA